MFTCKIVTRKEKLIKLNTEELCHSCCAAKRIKQVKVMGDMQCV